MLSKICVYLFAILETFIVNEAMMIDCINKYQGKKLYEVKGLLIFFIRGQTKNYKYKITKPCIIIQSINYLFALVYLLILLTNALVWRIEILEIFITVFSLEMILLNFIFFLMLAYKNYLFKKSFQEEIDEFKIRKNKF